MNASKLLRTLIPAALATMLIACERNDSPAPAPQPSAPTAATTPAGPKPATPDTLPDGVRLSFPHEVVYDKVLTGKSGEQRRRIIVEYLDGDAAAVEKALTEGFQAAGYRNAGDRQLPGGKRIVFLNPQSKARVYATFASGAQQRFHNKDAQGTVSFSWPTAGKG